MNLRSRSITPAVIEALGDTRIVVIQGARQVGKTTLIKQVLDEHPGIFVTFDDDITLQAARADPRAFLRQANDRTLAIDEVQRVPELILALKLEVDEDPRPGRFLLSGSANLLRLPTMQDSLAGRAESIDLYGFSQGELLSRHESFIDRVFDVTNIAGYTTETTRHDYLQRACTGGYPQAVARSTRRRRSTWFNNYVRRITQRDAPEISELERLSELPLILRLLAANNATELNLASLAAKSKIPSRTLTPYVDLLETLYLVQRIPAWSTNLTKRVVSRPKIVVQDSGLAAHLTDVTPNSATRIPELADQLLEGFVAGELQRQLEWSESNPRLLHYRDHNGAEVDFILESDDGSIVGIEVKAASSVSHHDTKWLSTIRDRLGKRFTAGVVLHTGRTSAPFGDRIWATPIDNLWAQ